MYYLSDDNDRAILLPHLPQPAGGPPLIVTSDIEIRFAYSIAADFFQKNQPGWLSEAEQADSFVEVAGDESFLSQGHTSKMYALWDTGICPGYICRNYSQQEDLSAHPLAKRGMSPCGVFEVKPSAWLHHLQSAEPKNLPAEITEIISRPVETDRSLNFSAIIPQELVTAGAFSETTSHVSAVEPSESSQGNLQNREQSQQVL